LAANEDLRWLGVVVGFESLSPPSFIYLTSSLNHVFSSLTLMNIVRFAITYLYFPSYNPKDPHQI